MSELVSQAIIQLAPDYSKAIKFLAQENNYKMGGISFKLTWKLKSSHDENSSFSITTKIKLIK